MEGFYLYGIVSTPAGLSEEIEGLGRHSVRLLPRGAMAAVVSASSLDPWAADEKNLTCHQNVLETLMKCHPVLPVRFNTFLKTEEAALALLQERQSEFVGALKRVEGKVEMGLRVLGDIVPSLEEGIDDVGMEAAGLGTRYLQQRLKGEKRQEAGQRLAADIQTFLSCSASDVRVRQFPGKRLFLNLACLVERVKTEAFCERAQALWKGFPQLHFLLTGPWPPYHFVSGETPHDTANLPGS